MRLFSTSLTVDRRRFADINVILFALIVTTLLSPQTSISDFKNKIIFGLLVTVSHFGTLLPVVRSERQWRNTSAYVAIHISQIISVSAFGLTCVAALTGFFVADVLRWICINAMITVAGLCGARLARRMVFERQNLRVNKVAGCRTLIVGTQSSARALAFRFASDSSLGVTLVGFIDLDQSQVGARINGLKVLGTLTHLAGLLSHCDIHELIVADPKVGNGHLLEILKIAQAKSVKTKILNDDSVKGVANVSAGAIRDIELHDLLPRPAVIVDLGTIEPLLSQRTVLVTGGGGSIGSELVRQILRLRPKKVLILDQSEFNLYAIETELKNAGIDTPIYPILSDLKEKAILDQVFSEHRPDFVFHAAAYKHVHLVETSSPTSIVNNLLATKNLLDCAVQHQVKNFVLISSDKAVNPLGIMGATKRACEMLVAQVADETGYRYCAVRFGNVLGSSGSFIPLLKQQIEAGGPVTITHRDMERYFMLIPEAVSLVLKAASISNPGDISILKMGDSLKIVEIARNLVMLMGKPENSIPFVYTGIRPGEKLKEELYLLGDELTTEVPNIVVLPRRGSIHKAGDRKGPSTREHIEQIIAAARRSDANATLLLKTLVSRQDLNFIDAEKEIGLESKSVAYSQSA